MEQDEDHFYSSLRTVFPFLFYNQVLYFPIETFGFGQNYRSGRQVKGETLSKQYLSLTGCKRERTKLR